MPQSIERPLASLALPLLFRIVDGNHSAAHGRRTSAIIQPQHRVQSTITDVTELQQLADGFILAIIEIDDRNRHPNLDCAPLADDFGVEPVLDDQLGLRQDDMKGAVFFARLLSIDFGVLERMLFASA